MCDLRFTIYEKDLKSPVLSLRDIVEKKFINILFIKKKVYFCTLF